MIVCGLKLSHDGCVAVIEDYELSFSVEVEKLANNPRYSSITDLNQIPEILAANGFKLTDIDRWVVDGWDGLETGAITVNHRSTRSRVVVAGYCELPGHANTSSATVSGTMQLNDSSVSYLSFPHVAGHWASSYWTSPFAKASEDATVLVWDGGSFPRLYHATGARMVPLGPAFPLFGHAYALAGFQFGPFVRGSQPGELWVAGKLMAYVAKGIAKANVMAIFEQAFKDHFTGDSQRAVRYRSEVGGFGSHVEPSREATEDFLSDAKKRLIEIQVSPEDTLASFHFFLQNKLVSEVAKMVSDTKRGQPTNLCFAGGCALNIKWNSAFRRHGAWRHVWVPPFCNDTGSAIGAAILGSRVAEKGVQLRWSVRSGPRLHPPVEPMSGWSARDCTPRQLGQRLHQSEAPVVVLDGRAELGPRALGGRSILASAVSAEMKDHLNEIKNREDYRPVAPVCLESLAPSIFDPGVPDPYMLFEHRVRPHWLERIPAVVHLDGTARLQTVNPDSGILFHILDEYYQASGVPVLCNTSANFNGRGFFPDAHSAMEWGKVPAVWADGVLYLWADAANLGVSPVQGGRASAKQGRWHPGSTG